MTTSGTVGFDSLQRSSAAFFAHPGHELRIYHWLTGARPVVSILTDGSGSHGSSRLAESRRLLGALGAEIGEVFGRFSDRDLYSIVLGRRIEILETVVQDFTATMIAAEADAVVTDAAEGFNPSHDLCCVLVVLAAERAGTVLGKPVNVFDFVLEAHPGSQPVPATQPQRVERLDEATLAGKLAAARGYRGLESEVERALDLYGADAFSVEVLRPVESLDAVLARIPDPPAYETHGERSVARGRYRTVLRLRENFLPLVEVLAGRPWSHDRTGTESSEALNSR